MCRELDALSQSIADFATGFDAGSLSVSDAGMVMRACGRMEASVASIKALAAARHAQSNAWQHEGFRSPSDQLAAQTGMSPSSARRLLDTGRRMATQPEVAQAALAGELSAEQAAAVSDGAAVDPSRARELIERARHSSVPELQQEVARVKAASTDAEARRRAIHAKRSFRRWTDTEGAFHARLYGLPDDGALLWQALDPIRRRLIMKRRETDPDRPNEPLEAIDYDATMILAATAVGRSSQLSPPELTELGLFPDLFSSSPPPAPGPAAPPPPGPAAPPPPGDPPTAPGQPTHSSPPGVPSSAGVPAAGRRRKKLAGSPTKIIIRVDYDALIRGHPLEGELCDMIGYGPVPVSVIEELVADANPFITAVLTRHHRLVGVFHHGRRPNVYQQTALEFLYPSCAAAGCNAHLGLQNDHRIDWARTHYTLIDQLDRLCPHHHGLKTRSNWALVKGVGKRPFVPPTDPRHPRHHPGDDPGTTRPP